MAAPPASPRPDSRVIFALDFVTPGVRAAAAAGSDDQKRTMSAREAIAAGADWVVVGRPIRDAPDPSAAAHAIAREVDAALAMRAAAAASAR